MRMNASGWKAVGWVMAVVAVLMFFFMIYGIVFIHPLCALLMFASMFLAAGSFFAIAKGRAEAVGPLFPREDPPSHAMSAGDDAKRGSGNGFCPYCGSPLDENHAYCGVCGRKI